MNLCNYREVTLHPGISFPISQNLVSPRPGFALPTLDSFVLVVFLSRHHPASLRPTLAISEAECPLPPEAFCSQEDLGYSVNLPAVGPSKSAWNVTSHRPLPSTPATHGSLVEGSKLRKRAHTQGLHNGPSCDESVEKEFPH